MSASIHLIVGTMTGTAETVADEVKASLEQDGHTVEVLPMDGLDATVFRRPGVFIVCTSTYGQGDVPDNARQLLEDLEHNRPDLGGLRYGIIALGDSTYADTFCRGGRRFDKLLRALNAKRLGARLEHDASGATLAEEDGARWASDWVQSLYAAAAA